MSEEPRPANCQTDPVSDEIARMISFLENERRRIYDELRSYPTPITACDQQFNYLLERQAQVNHALSRVRAAMAETDPVRRGEIVSDVLQTSDLFDDNSRRETPVDSREKN